MKKFTTGRIILLGLFFFGAVGIVSCSSTAVGTPTVVTAAVRLDGQVQNVVPDSRAIALAYPVQGYSVIAVDPAASITDTDGNPKVLQDIRPGMLIEISGQRAGSGALLAMGIRILPAPAAAPTLAGDPAAASLAVEKFLSSLALDPSGATSLKYLSRNLQDQVQKGTSVPLLSGIQTPYPSFNLIPVEPSAVANTLLVRVTLNYPVPINKVFTLIKEDGVWRINQIVTA